MRPKPRLEFCSYKVGEELKARLVRVSDRTGIDLSKLTRIALMRLVSAVEAGQNITPADLERDAQTYRLGQGRRRMPRPELPADQLTLTGVEVKAKRSKK